MLPIYALMVPMVTFTPPPDEAKANWLLLKISFLSFPPCHSLYFTVEYISTSWNSELQCHFLASQDFEKTMQSIFTRIPYLYLFVAGLNTSWWLMQKPLSHLCEAWWWLFLCTVRSEGWTAAWGQWTTSAHVSSSYYCELQLDSVGVIKMLNVQ